MLNTNHKNSICADTELLIAYLYDEANAAEKSEFAAHLNTCAACVEELAEFGFARTAVSEWRIAEFDHLATPIFEIPANEAQSLTIVGKPRSWFDGWRRMFTFRPALAMSALAIAVVLFSAALIIFNLKNDQEIAQENTDRKMVKAAVSPTISKAESAPIVSEDNDKFAAPPEKSAVKIADKKSSGSKNPATKVVVNQPARNNSSDVVPVKTIQNLSKGSQKSTGAGKLTASHLTDAEEEVDNSVRLADLFDEIGTR